jgi:hypothetical protein
VIDFAWLARDERNLFSLSPLRVIGDREIAGSRVMRKSGGHVLVASYDGEGRVVRCDGLTLGQVQDQAKRLAERTGDPVVVGAFAGVDAEGLPVWQSVGRVKTWKADPMSPEALAADIARLSARLEIIAGSEAAHMTVEAMEWLDWSWHDGGTETQWKRTEAGLRGVFSTPRQRMILAQRIALTRSTAGTVRRTGAAMSRMPGIRNTLGAALRLPDRRIAERLSQHHGFFVRDRYGAISQPLAARVRPFIENGLNQGMGREQIAGQIGRHMRGALRMPNYWRTVAGNASVRARSYAAGATMRTAGITHYRITAILDEATTETCLMLHDKLMPVDGAMALQDRLVNDPNPEGVYWHTPFVSDTGDELAVDFPDGTRNVIAQVATPGAGTGAPGTYRNVLSGSQMVSTAVGFPPYHHNCRTSIVAEV